MAKERIYTLDKFLGLNESGDGYTELKMGEASKITNFSITNAGNLALRPGITRLPIDGIDIEGIETASIAALWSGTLLERECLVVVYTGMRGEGLYGSAAAVFSAEDGDIKCLAYKGLVPKAVEYPVKIFYFGGRLYISLDQQVLVCLSFAVKNEKPVFDFGDDINFYTPLVVTGASPAGGGTTLENLNILSDNFRVAFSADGNATQYKLPDNAYNVSRVTIGNETYSCSEKGSYAETTHIFTFKEAPPEGVNNVIFECYMDFNVMDAAREKFFRMPYCEAYNGATDSRLFFYGDGTNVAYYTGTPSEGTGLYLPAMNEIIFDSSDTPITAMIRHYGKLMVFKSDSAWTISYEPTTLADGSVVAGFYMRSASREFGNDAPGQAQVVNNYPRTLSHGSLYEWKVTSSYYQDERYAKRISDSISKTLKSVPASQMVTCDDDVHQTYYIFLNDSKGTVLVNNYAVGTWTVYESPLTAGVKYAVSFGNITLFATKTSVFYFNENARFDEPVPGGEKIPIHAEWESGYMHFDADYLRKYSSELWLSVLPQNNSKFTVTAATDRRDSYVEKTVSNGLFGGYGNISYAHWSYVRSNAPRINRVRMKIKKFVYYKLIFRVTEPGAVATVLSVDQRIRYAGYAK